jgi:N,N'-diacetyllegionaminate synthase
VTRTIQIGSRQVGPGHSCLIIAEAGSNHNGSYDQARRLIDVAADAGVDVVKFQFFRADKLYPKSAGECDYLKWKKSIFEIIQEMEIPLDWLGPLSDHARARGLMFLVSPFDENSVDLVDPFVDFFKIASYELTHIPLVQHIAGKRKPVLISTGGASMSEVRTTVETFLQTGNDQLMLMQCTVSYPAPVESLNLETIPAMKKEFQIPVGLSDHSRDPVLAPIAAVALGANLIEKHYTFSNQLPGPDHKFALEPHELAKLVEAIRATERALGSGIKNVLPVEEELHRFARRCIFTVRPIAAGEIFTKDNIAVLRRGNHNEGLSPAAWDRVLGRIARQDIAPETPLTDSHVEP